MWSAVFGATTGAFFPVLTIVRMKHRVCLYMWVKVGHQKSVEIHDDVIRGVLSVYPEEKLASRPFFEESFASGTMSFNGLLNECEAIIVPWQTFFPEPSQLQTAKAEYREKQEQQVLR